MSLTVAAGGMEYGWAQSRNAEIEALKRQVEELRRGEAERQRQIEELQRKLEALEAQPRVTAPPPAPSAPTSPLDQEVQQLEAPPRERPTPPALLSRQVGGTTFRLIDISADVIAAAGGSTVGDEALQVLQGGGHDPRKNGFTLQNVELSLTGAVDPYFTGEIHVVFFVDPLEGETIVELEEAFLTTQRLPFGLQIEAGFFFTEFGLLNPNHPHAWHWQDQPIINTRLFGPDGMRQAGLRVGWLMPLPWFSELHLGVQNANGETMASFLANDEFFAERAIGGRPFVEREVDGPEDLVYLVRWVNSWELSREITGKLGASALFGPNAADGRTRIYGADLKMTWRPVHNFRGWPFLVWESEVMRRDYEAERFVGETEEGDPLRFAAATLHDWGFYTQMLYGFHYRWAAGLRVEYASGSGASVDGRASDPFRDDRFRLSPLLVWHPTEFSRLRLQYNYDHADHLMDDRAHSVWLGFEILYGAHPAHKY
jgi:hypothetical protein